MHPWRGVVVHGAQRDSNFIDCFKMNSKQVSASSRFHVQSIKDIQCAISSQQTPSFCSPPCRQIPALRSAISHHEHHLDLLRVLLFLNAATADAIGAISFLKPQMLIYTSIIPSGPVVFFFKDGIGLDGLEFGLEVANGMTMRTAIGATTRVGEVVAIVLRLVTRGAPGGNDELRFVLPKIAELTNCLCPRLPSSPS